MAHPIFLPSAALPARQPGRTGPAVPTLAALVVAVLLLHAWALRLPLAHIGQAQSAADRTAAFATRILAAAPPALPTVSPAPLAAAAVAKPQIKRFLEQKKVLPQVPYSSLATEKIAEQAPGLAAADAGVPAGGEDAAAAPAPPNAALATSDAPLLPMPTPAQVTPPAPAASAPALAALPAEKLARTAAGPVALPPSVQLEYKMTGSAKGLNYFATGSLDWRNGGTSYDAQMRVSALFIGARTMTSSGHIQADGLAPTRFSDKARTEVAAHFEPEKGLITFSANTPSVPWTPASQDRVSIFLQLAGLLAADPAGFAAGTSISVRTIGPRDADEWTFVVDGEELLQLPIGEFASLKLSRKPRREFDQKVEVWYAPALGFLPVRNRITQANGDFVDQQLAAIERR